MASDNHSTLKTDGTSSKCRCSLYSNPADLKKNKSKVHEVESDLNKNIGIKNMSESW